MTAPDLLACPFCGGEAVYDFHAKGQPEAWENDCDHWVYCRADDCFANVGLCESKAAAIAAWNTRATPAAIREAALREAAEVAKSWHRQWSMYSTGNEPTRDDRAGGITYGRLQGAETIADRILALITEKPHDRA